MKKLYLKSSVYNTGGVMASSKKLILSLATISCLSSLALAQISGPPYAIPYTQGNNHYYTLLGYYPGTQIEVNGNGSTNSIFLGKYAYVRSSNNGVKTLYVHATTDEKIDIRKILNKGIIAGFLNIENKGSFNNGSIHVGDIDNQGYIKKVYIGIWGENNGKIQLDSFKNSGIIYASNGDGILFEGKDTQIGNFINTGIIVGNHSNSSNNASVLIGRPDKNHGNTTIDLFLNEGLIGSNMAKYGVKFDSGNDSNGG
ncbi:hypothetical protein GC026_04065, partial [Campylobacter hepaticus]|nr:hypothetical protein [Campylobacter hepaticus]